MSEDVSSSTSSSPEPPEPMDLEDGSEAEAGAEGLEEAVREAVVGQLQEKEEELDLGLMAKEFAEYLVVDSKQDKQVLDDRIEGVVFRVEEFKSQLEHVHQNMMSSTEKMEDLHRHTQQLKELLARVDQVEAFVQLVTQHVDSLEELVTRAERDMDPSKLRKVFTAFPKLGKGKTAKSVDSSSKWQPPKPLKTREYFSSPT